MKNKILLFIFLATFAVLHVKGSNRWDISGHHSVQWNDLRGGIPHHDHVEMSGEKVSVVYYWGVDAQKQFALRRTVIWPMLRTVPNDTHASLTRSYDVDFLKGMTLNGRLIEGEEVKSVAIDGRLVVKSELRARNVKLGVTRILFPSTKEAAVCERYVLTNVSNSHIEVLVPSVRNKNVTNSTLGTRGRYCLVAQTAHTEDMRVAIAPGESVVVEATIQGYALADEKEAELNVTNQLKLRDVFVNTVTSQLDFKCENDTLNTMFAMAKIRGSESIYRTRGGLMHGPGGERYYAAIWCNDQCEYINPFFPFLGYDLGNEQALNVWRIYKKYINPEYKFVPWSIIAEGDDVFGPYDRGDAAMIAYGCGRYALQYADLTVAQEVWPLIEWCLEYCRRQINEDGVVRSDSDELENRLPSGDANLCTSCLYYDALQSAAYLSESMGMPKSVAHNYRKQAADLRQAIAKYFHATIEGYDTYRYYKENTVLRSWICIPLTMGIFDRAEGTVQAMFSPQLWTENGMLSAASDKIFWDRSTLYGLRGALAAGYSDKTLQYLQAFSAVRLLGEHVPYVVEAWPEGSQRHLSAENGLYCRIFTEGLLGFRATGFDSFDITPQMPSKWDRYSFKNMYACAKQPYDVDVMREGAKLKVVISRDGKVLRTAKVAVGKTVRIKL